jgi:hypothetical protein
MIPGGKMEKTEIQKILQPIVWDYHIVPCELYEVAIGQKERVGWFTQERALIRILERLSWYDLVNLFGIDKLTKLLTKEIISQIRFNALQEKYEFARKVLQGEPVSFSGWSPEYREKIRHTLLSNRWYRTQQRIFSP